VERAHQRNPAFVLEWQNARPVAEICRRLDGIPLAIELAAARVGLSVQEISERLGDSLKLLTGGDRTATPETSDAQGGAGLELRAPLRRREEAVQAALGLRGWLDARGGRSGGSG
ncbi:MAG: hypothetical protein H0T74_03350, partial [Rubrobacteraceae bacterium]|nr:hypothetical protein [Rubrobacteraceae bacterium]